MTWCRSILVILSIIFSGCEAEQKETASNSLIVGFIYDPALVWQSRSYAIAKRFHQKQFHTDANCQAAQYTIKVEANEIEATPQNTAKAVLSLINKRKVNVIVSPLSSRHLQAAMPYIEKSSVPLIAVAATSLKHKQDAKVVTLSIDNDSFAKDLAEVTKDKLGSRHVVVIYRNNDRYSRDMAELFAKHFNAIDGETLKLEFNKVDDRLIENLEANLRPDSVIFLPIFKQDIVPLASKLAAKQISQQILGSDSWDVSYLSQFSFLEGAIVAQSWAPSRTPSAKEIEFLSRYRSQNHRDPIPTEVLTEDAMNYIRHIMCAHKNFRPELFARFLAQSTAYTGISGIITPQSSKGRVHRPSYVIIEKGGALPWPIENGEIDD